MGYELIDEYLRAGRDAADQAPAYASPASGSAEHLSERVLEYTSELAQLGLELVQALARSPTQSPPSGVAPPFARPRAGAAAHGGRETSGPPAEFQQTAFQLKVESTQRVNVSVELSRVSANASLLAQTPRRYQPQARRTPERGIELSIKLGAGTCAIRVRIAKSVAPGTYRSLIVERATNLPRGSIAIDVAGKPST
jgi:hypothetical protein